MEKIPKTMGISIDKTSGKLSISNYENLAEKLVDNNGALTVKSDCSQKLLETKMG